MRQPVRRLPSEYFLRRPPIFDPPVNVALTAQRAAMKGGMAKPSSDTMMSVFEVAQLLRLSPAELVAARRRARENQPTKPKRRSATSLATGSGTVPQAATARSGRAQGGRA